MFDHLPGAPMTLALRFDTKHVRGLAARFGGDGDDRLDHVIAPRARAAGMLTKADFLELCAWKTPRTKPRCASNDESFVRAVTATALSTPDERLRIEVLTLLDGVHWPTASVILHFCHADAYPVLDWRALWSVGIEGTPPYRFELWREYTLLCRSTARRCRVSMRALDKALWQFSYEEERRRG